MLLNKNKKRSQIWVNGQWKVENNKYVWVVATGNQKKLDIYMWMVSGLKVQTDGVGLKDTGNKYH